MSSEPDSPELQKAKTFFQYGNEATTKSNFDYAIDMYRQACKLVPDNMMFRQALRGVERRKFNNDHSKVGMMAGAGISRLFFVPGQRVPRGIGRMPWRFARRRSSTIPGMSPRHELPPRQRKAWGFSPWLSGMSRWFRT